MLPESVAGNDITSPDSLLILAEFASSTSLRVGNLDELRARLVQIYNRGKGKEFNKTDRDVQFSGLERIIEIKWP